MTLEIKNLSVSYGDFEVLKDISFHLEDGQLIGLVAPNGTGKTTLFNAIMRFIQVKEGQIFIDGKEYTASDKDVLNLHQKITFFPDQADLFENFSGREHIEMYAEVWAGREGDVDEIINRLQMADYVDRKVQEYSLGMRQRLCFAMMVAADTPIMFMDEVMNGLDPENVSLVSDVLIDLRHDGKIVMIASHLLDNLDEYADKVFFLKDKKLHHINNLNEKRPLFYKIVASDAQVKSLEKEGYLTPDTIRLSNQVLCVPIDDLTLEEDKNLYEKLRDLNVESIEIAPLGTSEYYSYLYGLRIYSFDRGHEVHEEA
ncbi:MAG TPA: ATP-binding cassette domain-containing protein [Atopostipes sp.]|nr:ATP-binding cassette domain-containing protein [Atopostipes sp.]